MIGCKYLANTLIMGDDSVDGDSIPVAGNTDRKNIIKKLEVKVSTVKMVILSLNFPHHMFHLLLEYLISWLSLEGDVDIRKSGQIVKIIVS